MRGGVSCQVPRTRMTKGRTFKLIGLDDLRSNEAREECAGGGPNSLCWMG
jgi:hypothetical protein